MQSGRGTKCRPQCQKKITRNEVTENEKYLADDFHGNPAASLRVPTLHHAPECAEAHVRPKLVAISDQVPFFALQGDDS